MTALLLFLKSPFAKYGLIALVCLAVALGLRHSGVMAERHTWEARMKEAAQHARQVEETGRGISAVLRAANDGENLRIEYRTKTLIERIPQYVPTPVDCPTVPSGFVSVFNAAATGSELPASPSGPVEADSGVTLAAVAETSAYNFGIAQQLRARVLAWETWYPLQKAAHEGHGTIDIPGV